MYFITLNDPIIAKNKVPHILIPIGNLVTKDLRGIEKNQVKVF